MLRRARLAAGAVALSTAVCGAAPAQINEWLADSGIRLEPSLEKLVESGAPDGAPRYDLQRGPNAADGEQFVLTVRFTNTLGATVDGVRITSAIPAGLRYVPGSATAPGGFVLLSADGGRTFGAERELAQRGTEAAPVVYTHVRWLLEAPLESGVSGFVRLRASKH
ncbi:MAG TPA: DUF11 domain-containing protein [Gammaproteobacteria bacterium]|jgi:uncharacterized repeat protein (TIGR01451 family)|nr:DUF11 domain-containing protein [Gammaproteobacteria bacterium]